jgi:mannose-6-phosphate isomerase class I
LTKDKIDDDAHKSKKAVSFFKIQPSQNYQKKISSIQNNEVFTNIPTSQLNIAKFDVIHEENTAQINQTSIIPPIRHKGTFFNNRYLLLPQV